MTGTLQVLRACERWVAIDKPAGLVVHRGEHTRDEPAVLQLVRDQLGRYVHPVHRLDRATSGVLLLALDVAAARWLAAAFAEREVDKRYLAIVRGWIDEHGLVDYALTDEGAAIAVPAVTEFARLAAFELPVAIGPHPTARYSLVEAFPRTGRTHQLRKHFAHLRHPIVGDVNYGDGRHNRLFRERFGVHRLLLHAQRLAFTDLDGSSVVVEAPVPDAFDCLS